MIDLSSSLVDGFQEPKAQGFMDLKGALDDLAGELLVLHLKEKTFLARMSRIDTVTIHFFRNRALDF